VKAKIQAMNLKNPLCLILAVLCLACWAHASEGSDWRSQGPRALIMTYRVAPAHRIAFIAAVRATTFPMLEKLRKKGELDSYHVLANRYVDSASWDMMLILDFHNSPALARWRRVEAQTPAALAPQALRLVAAVETAPADLMFGRAVASRPGDPTPVYLVVPYELFVSEDEYLTYAAGYVVPQVDGWMDARALDSYKVYLPRYPAGRDWSALLVLAYHGDAGLARRDAVVKAVRAHLAASAPQWEAFAQQKQKLRTERQAVIADELLP
jgi:hypothetical protein